MNVLLVNLISKIRTKYRRWKITKSFKQKFPGCCLRFDTSEQEQGLDFMIEKKDRFGYIKRIAGTVDINDPKYPEIRL